MTSEQLRVRLVEHIGDDILAGLPRPDTGNDADILKALALGQSEIVAIKQQSLIGGVQKLLIFPPSCKLGSAMLFEHLFFDQKLC